MKKKVPKSLIRNLIDKMIPDGERKDIMFDVLDKLNLDGINTSGDVKAVLNNPDKLNELVDSVKAQGVGEGNVNESVNS